MLDREAKKSKEEREEWKRRGTKAIGMKAKGDKKGQDGNGGEKEV